MNSQLLREKLIQGDYDDKLIDLYVDESLLSRQKNRYVEAIDQFVHLYGEQDISIFSAPGRSEVGGNHTDHQHGKVIAAAINLDAIAVVSKSDFIKILSDDIDISRIELNDLERNTEEFGTSESLVKGVLARLQELGYNIGGFVSYMTSDVLMGAGLSSSAAFEVLVGTIISGLYNDMKIDPVLIAQVGQYAENVYFDKPCGLMDQCASAVGSLIHIDFIDIKNPKVEKINVDFSSFKHSLCIVDTKGSHANLTGDYAAIPAEMKSVAKSLDEEFLSDVDEDNFYNNIAQLRETCGDRSVLRAIHLFEENKRVDQEVAALLNNDFETFKAVVKESGDSSYKFLQNVYTHHDVQQQAVSLALAMSESIIKDAGVCRVHGGGFAGTIQAFVKDEEVPNYKKRIEQVFGEGACHVLKVRKYGAIEVIK